MEYERVTRQQIKDDYLIAHEFVEYLYLLAKMDESYPLTAGQIWKLFNLGFRDCVLWDEAAEICELPTVDWCE